MSRTDDPCDVVFPKSPTGIAGLDEITGGGLPKGRPTLVCGAAGCGKTLLAMEFLVNGIRQYDEPGVFVSFEETEEDLVQNVRTLGWGLPDLIKQEKMRLDYVHIEPSLIEETGLYDLEGLFIRLGQAIDAIGAKRVALDTIAALFTGFSDTGILRGELRRLFRWLKEKGVTAVVTAEPGDTTLTRHGLEEYVSDCVVLLTHSVKENVATRHLRVLKYRGSNHGANRFPFLIDGHGISVTPITSVTLAYPVSTDRISTGIPRLDRMLGGEGYYRGTSVLISGTAGTGKTSLAAHFSDAACSRGERCLYFAFEEAKHQVVRNMRSIGLDLQPWLDDGLLRFHAARPTLHSLEMHLAVMHNLVDRFSPAVVIVDPISNLTTVGQGAEVRAMLTRLIDFLKGRQITALFTDLTHDGGALESTQSAISSLMDTWLLLRDIESGLERNRGLYVLKSRGMGHSHQIREFTMNDDGIQLQDVYLGPSGKLLTGTARYQKKAEERATVLAREEEIARQRREIALKRQVMEAKIASLRAEFGAEQEKLQRAIADEERYQHMVDADRRAMADMRGAEEAPPSRSKEA